MHRVLVYGSNILKLNLCLKPQKNSPTLSFFFLFLFETFLPSKTANLSLMCTFSLCEESALPAEVDEERSPCERQPERIGPPFSLNLPGARVHTQTARLLSRLLPLSFHPNPPPPFSHIYSLTNMNPFEKKKKKPYFYRLKAGATKW